MADRRKEILDLISQLKEELKELEVEDKSKQSISLVEANTFFKVLQRTNSDISKALDFWNWPATSRFPWDTRNSGYRYTCGIFQNTGLATKNNDCVMIGYLYSGSLDVGYPSSSIPDSDTQSGYYNFHPSNYKFFISSSPYKSQDMRTGQSIYHYTQWRPCITYHEG